MLQMQEFSKIDCSKDKYGHAEILWSQAYNPNLILGATEKSYAIYTNLSDVNNKAGTYNDEIIKRNQRHDILLEFRCPDRWLVRAAIKPTIVNKTMLEQT